MMVKNWSSSKVGISCLLILSVVLIFCSGAVAQETLSNAAQQYNEGKVYRDGGQYAQAQQIFESVAVDTSDIDVAFDARRSLIKMHINKTGDDAAATAAIEKLITDFPSHAKTLEILETVVTRYKRTNKPDKEQYVRQILIQNFPDSLASKTIQAQACQPAILELVSNGDDSGALAAIDSMIANNGAIPAVLKILDDAAKKCGKAGNYTVAKDIYKKITDNFPAGVLEDDASAPGIQGAAEALKGVEAIEYAKDIEEDINNGEYYQAKVSVARFIQEHRDSVGFPMVLFKIGNQFEQYMQYEDAYLIYDYIDGGDPNSGSAMTKAKFLVAERYYNTAIRLDQSGQKAEFEEVIHKAMTLAEEVMGSSPEQALGNMTGDLYHMLAECHRYVGEYRQAMVYYEELLAKWPDYKNNWYTQHSVGMGYQEMKKAGTMAADEADSKTRKVYEQLIAAYPDCKAAKAVNNWLVRN